MISTFWSHFEENRIDLNPNQEQLISKNPFFEITDSLNFKIKKGQLGNIRIGMTISEAESQFHGFTKTTDYAENFGFGGGSPAYLYSKNDEIYFALIPKLDSDSIMAIIAISPKFQTPNGLFPNSNAGEVAKVNPNIKVTKDLMNDWENMTDENNNWSFVFCSEYKTVGEYDNLMISTESKVINETIKSSWITIE